MTKKHPVQLTDNFYFMSRTPMLSFDDGLQLAKGTGVNDIFQGKRLQRAKELEGVKYSSIEMFKLPYKTPSDWEASISTEKRRFPKATLVLCKVFDGAARQPVAEPHDFYALLPSFTDQKNRWRIYQQWQQSLLRVEVVRDGTLIKGCKPDNQVAAMHVDSVIEKCVKRWSDPEQIKAHMADIPLPWRS